MRYTPSASAKRGDGMFGFRHLIRPLPGRRIPGLRPGLADSFAEGANGAKLHSASGFVCPQQIGRSSRTRWASVIRKLARIFVPIPRLMASNGTVTASAARDTIQRRARAGFVRAERYRRTNGRRNDANAEPQERAIGGLTRTYETRSWKRCISASSLPARSWELAVQVTIDMAEPRDNDAQAMFLNAVYAEANIQDRRRKSGT